MQMAFGAMCLQHQLYISSQTSEMCAQLDVPFQHTSIPLSLIEHHELD